jgi:hypothetical protein
MGILEGEAKASVEARKDMAVVDGLWLLCHHLLKLTSKSGKAVGGRTGDEVKGAGVGEVVWKKTRHRWVGAKIGPNRLLHPTKTNTTSLQQQQAT